MVPKPEFEAREGCFSDLYCISECSGTFAFQFFCGPVKAGHHLTCFRLL